MAATLPYTYIQCPCATEDRHKHSLKKGSKNSPNGSGSNSEDEDDGFDPKSARANYGLFELDSLFYCEICAGIRCQRCLVEEVVTWFCPSCLFEVPSSTVKSEGNRCTRSCFQCPCCTSPLTVTPVDPTPSSQLLATAPPSPAYVLSCGTCVWTSASIGITFAKNTSIYNQLLTHLASKSKSKDAKLAGITSPPERAERKGKSTLSMVHEDIAEEDESSEATPPIPQVETEEPKPTADERFKLLRDFHHNQIRSQNAGDRFSGLGSDPGSAYSSPSALNRIMSLYTSFSSPSSAKQRILPPREARPEEGLLHLTSPSTELCRIAKLREGGYSGTSSASQRQLQLPRLPGSEPQLVKELLPVPYLLRTKRTKRCKTCKHIVVRPEAKVSTARFRMKMVAASYIPSLSLRPLPSTGVNSLASSQQLALPSFSGTIGQGQRAVGEGGEGVLLPHRTAQFLLTVKNPLFERVRITLATPPTVPGRHAHRVTLLCPGFEVGAAGEGLQDVWADALADPSTKSRSRESTGARGRESLSGSGSGDATGMAEAGKVYERGRNSVGVVIEIVPAPLREPNYPASEDVFLDAKSQAGRSEAGRSEARSFSSALGHFESTGVEGDFHGDASDEDDDAIKEDEDILEIPVRVRVEWEADALDDVTAGVAEKKEVAGDGERVRRELSYWVVLGVGRVARDM